MCSFPVVLNEILIRFLEAFFSSLVPYKPSRNNCIKNR